MDKLAQAKYNLTKQAGLSSLVAKFIGKLFANSGKKSIFTMMGNAYRSGGLNKALQVGSKFARPEIENVGGRIVMRKFKPPGKDNMVSRSVGRMSREFVTLTSGFSKDKGIFGNTSQLVKNIYNDTKRQFTDARYRAWEPNRHSNVFKAKNAFGKENEYIKTKFGLKRKVVGYADDGRVITKKRLPAYAMAAMVTPAGFAATSALTGDAKDGFKDYFAWKTPIGPTMMTIDMVKSVFK